jgi:tetratricopeptide (TPR) repeat protein
MGLGVAQEVLEQKGAAVQSMLRAVEKDPAYFPTYSFLADMADSGPGTQAAIRRRLAEFVVTHPESAESHFDYALGLWKQSRRDPGAGSRDEIIAQLKAAIERDPRSEKAHFTLGQVYADMADLAGAEREFRAALEIEPGNAQAHYHLSQVYRRQGKNEMANEEIEKFRSLRGNPGDDPVSPPISLRRLSYPAIQRASEAGRCPPRGR